MTAPEIVQLVVSALEPVLTNLSRESDERIQRVIGEAYQRAQAIEQEVAELHATSNARRGNGYKSMMDMKAFQKIHTFKDGHAKWKTVRSQIEHLAEIAFP